jgi:flagellar export protein FliJ
MPDDDRYRPAPVLDARARAERVRRGELAAAVGDARAAEDRLATARAALVTALADRDAQPTAARRDLADRFVTRRRRELEHLADEAARRAGEVDAARRTLARARADREVIERHFARWREQRRKLADRRED